MEGTKLIRRQIFDFWVEATGAVDSKIEQVFNRVCHLVGAEYFGEAEEADLKKTLRQFCGEINRRWAKCSRNQTEFRRKYSTWLQKEFIFNLAAPRATEEAPTTISEEARPSTSRKRRGRPTKPYTSSSVRSKRRKTADLLKNISTPELAHATKMKLRTMGKTEAAKVVEEATETTPTRAIKIRKAWKRKGASPIQFSADQALSLLVECKESRKSYETHRMFAKANRANIYPPYYKVQAAKKACYPSAEAISITEKIAEVKIQALLDHTISRILQLQAEVIRTLDPESLKNLVLLVKWGFDGSSGHSEYKQKYSVEETVQEEEKQEGEGSEGQSSYTVYSDSDIFLSSLVPIQMVIEDSSGRKIIWQNPRPSSPRYCRPIRIQFAKESVQLSKQEEDHIQQQINCLQPFENITVNGIVRVTSKLVLTMVDGKVCNSLTDTSSAQKCYLCGSTPKLMNNIDKALEAKVDEASMKFGLSTLHAWIRFFEYFLHVSYRLEIKSWKSTGVEKKTSMINRKKRIQNDFQKKMGLKVDRVRAGGAGTSNDGNTARRFFSNPSLSAEITGIEEELIFRCSVILSAMSSGYKIKRKEFGVYAKETAVLLVKKYPWYYLPASIHKILIHGSQVIGQAILPIGQLSEEAQESRNKDLKHYREKHTRKISRVATMTDLLNALLVSSDPLISSMRPLPKKTSLRMAKDVLDLLDEPDIRQGAEKEEVATIESAIDSESETTETGESDSDDFEYAN